MDLTAVGLKRGRPWKGAAPAGAAGAEAAGRAGHARYQHAAQATHLARAAALLVPASRPAAADAKQRNLMAAEFYGKEYVLFEGGLLNSVEGATLKFRFGFRKSCALYSYGTAWRVRGRGCCMRGQRLAEARSACADQLGARLASLQARRRARRRALPAPRPRCKCSQFSPRLLLHILAPCPQAPPPTWAT